MYSPVYSGETVSIQYTVETEYTVQYTVLYTVEREYTVQYTVLYTVERQYTVQYTVLYTVESEYTVLYTVEKEYTTSELVEQPAGPGSQGVASLNCDCSEDYGTRQYSLVPFTTVQCCAVQCGLWLWIEPWHLYRPILLRYI